MPDETISTTINTSESPAAGIILKTISDIALEKLKEDAQGFYSLDFLMPSFDKPVLKAEAGIKLTDLFKISLWGQYDISSQAVCGGIHIGGEIKL
jgi:hypothetical protein